MANLGIGIRKINLNADSQKLSWGIGLVQGERSSIVEALKVRLEERPCRYYTI